MSESVSLPALGESVTEGTVTRWLKQVGDRVEVDEPLLEVSTDKVDTEIPSPVAGVVEAILVAEDETVEVGTPLVTIGDGSGAAAPPAKRAAAGRGARTPRPHPLAAPPACTRRGARARCGTRARRATRTRARRATRTRARARRGTRARARRGTSTRARARRGTRTRARRAHRAAAGPPLPLPLQNRMRATSPRSCASSRTSKGSTCRRSRAPASAGASASRTCCSPAPRLRLPLRPLPLPRLLPRSSRSRRCAARRYRCPTAQGHRRARRHLDADLRAADHRRRGRRHPSWPSCATR